MTDSNTLLNYGLLTSPDPVQVSPPEGDTVNASLTFVISNSTEKAIMLTSVKFNIPNGTDQFELTNDPGAILYSAEPAETWVVSPDESDWGVYMLRSRSGAPVEITTTSVLVQLYHIPVNQEIGTVELGITETAAYQGENPVLRTTDIDVTKFPYGFYVNNFSPNVPLVGLDKTVTLTWQGTVMATYFIDYGGAEGPVNVTQQRSWTSPGLKNDTTFLLRATVKSQDQEVTRDLTTTVIVADPEIQATTLEVTKASNLLGETTIGRKDNLNPVTFNGKWVTLNSGMTVHGSVDMEALSCLGSLTVAENWAGKKFFSVDGGGSAFAVPVTVGGTLKADGKLTTLQGSDVTGDLWTGGSAIVDRDLTVKGNFNMTGAGAVGMMSNFMDRGMPKGNYRANTDGFLVVYIYADNVPAGDDCWGWATAQTAMGRFYTTAGTVKAIDGSQCMNGQFTLPIAKGYEFILNYGFTNGNDSNPTVKFYFVGLGSSSLAYTFLGEITEDEERQSKEYVEQRLAWRRKNRKSSSAADVAAAVIRALKTENTEELEWILKEQLGLR